MTTTLYSATLIVPGTILGTAERGVNQTDKNLCPLGASIPVKSYIVNILGFVGHKVSVIIIQLYYGSTKAATDKIQTTHK